MGEKGTEIQVDLRVPWSHRPPSEAYGVCRWHWGCPGAQPPFCFPFSEASCVLLSNTSHTERTNVRGARDTKAGPSGDDPVLPWPLCHTDRNIQEKAFKAKSARRDICEKCMLSGATGT